jgi:hypothetical protein
MEPERSNIGNPTLKNTYRLQQLYTEVSAHAIKKQVYPDGTELMFQSPPNSNILNISGPRQREKLQGLLRARKMIDVALAGYLTARPDCVLLDGPAHARAVCSQMEKLAAEWAAANVQPDLGTTIADVWSSWFNVESGRMYGQSKTLHSHQIFQTAISGVYYPAVRCSIWFCCQCAQHSYF